MALDPGQLIMQAHSFGERVFSLDSVPDSAEASHRPR